MTLTCGQQKMGRIQECCVEFHVKNVREFLKSAGFKRRKRLSAGRFFGFSRHHPSPSSQNGAHHTITTSFALVLTIMATTTATLSTTTGPDPAVMEAIERGNSVVFLDIALGEGPNAASLGRIKLELFTKDVRNNDKRCDYWNDV